MLSFATEFPVDASRNSKNFLVAVKEWLLGSPHTVFEESDFEHFETQREWLKKKSNEQIESLQFESSNIETAAIRYTKNSSGLEWVSTIVFTRNQPSSWIGVRTSCESQHPSVRLPLAKKPVFVRTFLKLMGGGKDGDVPTSNLPKHLTNSDISFAARCILGKSGSRLPVIYVSAPFQGDYSVTPAELAEELAGMAHVLIEPNRQFSVRLMTEVGAENVYGGTIGVYWPDSGGRRSYFLGRQYDSRIELHRAIFDEIRQALVNRRPLAQTTWSNVQEQISHRKSAQLREIGSTAVEEYVKNFDSTLTAKQQALDDAEREILRLQAEVRRHQASNPLQSGIVLSTAPEQDLYPGEILGVIIDALNDAVSRVGDDSRRRHVLKGVVEANPSAAESEVMRSKLKALLRDFRSLDAKIRAGLHELGFEISEDGKHIKIVFQGDDRYTFTMPKSGSDHRGGLNLASDISRLLF